MRRDTPTWLALLAAGLFLVSLTQPVAIAAYLHGPSEITGTGLLVMGWIGMMIFQFAWWANLCLPIALWMLLRARPSSPRTLVVLAVVMAVLAIDALLWTEAPNDISRGPITAYLLGYYLWLGAMAAVVAALLLRARDPG